MKKVILTIVTAIALFSCSPEEQPTLSVSDVDGVLYSFKTEQWSVEPEEYGGGTYMFSEKLREECPDEWDFNTNTYTLDITNNNYNRICDNPRYFGGQSFSVGVGVIQIEDKTYTFESVDSDTITLTHYYQSDQYIVYYFRK